MRKKNQLSITLSNGALRVVDDRAASCGGRSGAINEIVLAYHDLVGGREPLDATDLDRCEEWRTLPRSPSKEVAKFAKKFMSLTDYDQICAIDQVMRRKK